jgi:hypothetical protein
MAIFVEATTAFTDPNLPVLANYDAVLGQNAVIRGWMVPDASRLTQASGRAGAVADRSAAGISAVQALTGKQPAVVASKLAGRPSLTFANGRLDSLSAPAAIAAPTGDFSLVAVLVPLATVSGNSRYIAYVGGVNYGQIYISSDKRVVFGVGTGTSSTNQARALSNTNVVVADAPLFAIGAWDATGKVASLSLDGGLTWITGVNAVAPAPSNGDLRIGTDYNGAFGLDGDVLDIMPVGINLAASGNVALLATIRQYVSDRYRIGA